MSDTKIPAWAVRAMYEMSSDYYELTGDGLPVDKYAAIIAKHAPRPMRLNWETGLLGATFYADTPFGRYKVGKSWWTFNDGPGHDSDGREKNKAAAQADFAERVAKCMEAGDGE